MCGPKRYTNWNDIPESDAKRLIFRISAQREHYTYPLKKTGTGLQTHNRGDGTKEISTYGIWGPFTDEDLENAAGLRATVKQICQPLSDFKDLAEFKKMKLTVSYDTHASLGGYLFCVYDIWSCMQDKKYFKELNTVVVPKMQEVVNQHNLTLEPLGLRWVIGTNADWMELWLDFKEQDRARNITAMQQKILMKPAYTN